MTGVWCLHCERAWHGDLAECPSKKCDGGFFDMFDIRGEFENGERVEIYTPRFEELRAHAWAVGQS